MSSISCSLRGFCFLAICIAALTRPASAQTDSARICGIVADRSGRTIRGAVIELVDIDRDLHRTVETNAVGFYIFPDVRPGNYRMQASASGFQTLNVTEIEIAIQDNSNHNLTLFEGSASDAVTAQGKGMPANITGSVGTAIDQKLVTELPLNGRSFQTLFQLIPGIVITPTSFTSPGQFSVNGQRTNANYFLVDGASANVAISVGANPGQSAGGSLPALTAFGGTNSLVSVDDVQEFAILTSSFAPELGRTPGGQVSIITRSGTNAFHGNLFDYLRNDALDANDWFASRHSLKRAALRQNDFGGVLGGPVRSNRTFFFLSYEGLRLRQPTTGQSDVPSLAARQSAPVAMRPFFNAYPLPNGPDEGNGLAQAAYAFSNPLVLNATSFRIDHHFGESLAIFGRYNVSASDQKLRGATVTSLSSVTDLHFALQTLSFGSTWIKSHFTDDTRLNWSRSSATSNVAIDGFGGAIPVSAESAIPAPFSDHNSLFQFVPALSAQHPDLEFGRNAANFQSQVNLSNIFTWELWAHSLKAGIDIRNLRPQIKPAVYVQQTLFSDIAAALANTASLSIVQALTPVRSTFRNLSLFAQDTWRPIAHLNLTYGLRWDFNPTPTGRGDNGLTPFAVQGINDLPTLSLARPGSALYRATTNNFAPRFGLAYELRNSPRTESVIKAGAGMFYDFGNGPIGNAFSGGFFPFSAVKILSGVPFPLSPNDAAPPSITANPPFDQIVAFPAVLKLPYSYQWNVSIEQSLGTSQTLTAGYVGSAGHSLLRTDLYFGGQAGVPPSFQRLLFTNNGGYSHYNALQVQIRRRTSRCLDLVASYTLSHSLDNVSTDAAFTVPARFLDRRADYGPSDFDIRHAATIGVDYNLPVPGHSSLAKVLFSDWVIDSIFTFRSAPPINVVLSRETAPEIGFRPDLIPGVPIYLDDSGAPGKVRINPAAFLVPATQRQGNLARNRLRGFPLLETDLAIRRHFHLADKFGVQVRIEAFNVFNHPNFASQGSQLGVVDSAGKFFPQSGFGIAANMFGNGLQTEGPGSGFSPLYQIGQARSLQAALKLEF